MFPGINLSAGASQVCALSTAMYLLFIDKLGRESGLNDFGFVLHTRPVEPRCVSIGRCLESLRLWIVPCMAQQESTQFVLGMLWFHLMDSINVLWDHSLLLPSPTHTPTRFWPFSKKLRFLWLRDKWHDAWAAPMCHCGSVFAGFCSTTISSRCRLWYCYLRAQLCLPLNPQWTFVELDLIAARLLDSCRRNVWDHNVWTFTLLQLSGKSSSSIINLWNAVGM